jgi:hypothetical protein
MGGRRAVCSGAKVTLAFITPTLRLSRLVSPEGNQLTLSDDGLLVDAVHDSEMALRRAAVSLDRAMRLLAPVTKDDTGHRAYAKLYAALLTVEEIALPTITEVVR